MFWLVVLSTVSLGVGVIVFILTRDSFHASRARRETPPVASPEKSNSDAEAINTMMKKKLSVPPPSNPSALFSEHCAKDADAIADILAHVPHNPLLLDEPKLYLRLEEHDDSLERLLIRRLPGRGTDQTSPSEFSIGVTEKNEPPLERTKAM